MSRSDSPECRVLDHATLLCCKISLKSPAHILKHHLWNSLVNKSILAFIPHFGSFLCRSWRSKLVVSDRQHKSLQQRQFDEDKTKKDKQDDEDGGKNATMGF